MIDLNKLPLVPMTPEEQERDAIRLTEELVQTGRTARKFGIPHLRPHPSP